MDRRILYGLVLGAAALTLIGRRRRRRSGALGATAPEHAKIAEKHIVSAETLLHTAERRLVEAKRSGNENRIRACRSAFDAITVAGQEAAQAHENAMMGTEWQARGKETLGLSRDVYETQNAIVDFCMPKKGYNPPLRGPGRPDGFGWLPDRHMRFRTAVSGEAYALLVEAEREAHNLRCKPAWRALQKAQYASGKVSAHAVSSDDQKQVKAATKLREEMDKVTDFVSSVCPPRLPPGQGDLF